MRRWARAHRRIIVVFARASYAAFDSDGVTSSSGAGPHTYAQYTGGGSSRLPREMTIPIGSSFTRAELLKLMNIPLIRSCGMAGRAVQRHQPCHVYPHR